MECWLFWPEMDISSYLYSPEKRGTTVQTALAPRMPKKEAVQWSHSLELGRAGVRELEVGRKKNGGHGPRIIS